MLPASTMPGDTPHPVSYYSNRTGELKGLPHPTQSYSLYSGAEVNGVSQSGRAPLRNSHFLDPVDSPVSPRTHQPDLNAPWAHHQRSPLDHRAALEPSIVHRDVSHSSPGILSPDCRQLHSLARPSNTIHPGHVPPPLSRERESYEMRPFVPADRMLQHSPALQPPIQAEHQPKSFPPHHQDYNYSQAGTTSPYSRMSVSTPGGEFVRPYPPSFDSRAQHTTTPGYPHHIERRNTAPHQLGVSMYSEPRRESHTPSGPSTTMSPPQDYVRMQSGQSSNYISTSDSRHQNYRLHQSPHEVSHNDLIHSPLHNSMGSRQLEFLPRQHSTGSILEPSGMPRVMNQKYTAPSQPTAIVATKQVTGEGFEPPSKRVKTEEHGSAGQSTGDVSDQDTEDEDMYEAEDRAGSGTPDPKKRKYSRKSSSRPPMQRNRGTTHISPDIDEDQLPAYVDGVRVNKEWGLTKAGKARQRLPQACIACRKKKIKCIIAKGQIMCEKCKQQNMVCEFKQSTSSRSKGNSAAPENETSHDRSLDDYETPSTYAREDAEMSGIAELKREGDSDMHGMDDIPAIEPTTSLRQEEEVPVTQTAVSQPAPMFVPDVMNADLSTASRISEVSQLGNNSRKVHVREMAAQWQGIMPRPRNSSVGSAVAGTPGLGSSPSSPVSTEVYQYTPTRFYHSTRSRSTPIASTPTVPSIPCPMGEDTRDHLLPEPKALEHLCTLYFTHLYSQHYPFLHRGTFMANLETHRPVLLFSLCAIAARFSPQYRDKEEEFAVQARQRILDSFDVQWLEVVQAMILMGLHDFGSNNGHKAWMFAGMAVRLGSALNLNMEPRKEKGQSPIEVEVQRRTYWSYYLMDRLNSYGVARPFLTQDHDCHIQLPCDQDSFENGREVITEHLGGKNPHDPHKGNEHMGAFAYLVRITSIWGDVLKYIHLSGVVPHDAKEEQPEFEPGAEFIKFVNKLKEWKVSLPKSLRYSDENLQAQIKAGTVGTYIMMHVMFHTCAVYVYRYVTVPERAMEFISQRVPKGYIVNSIRKIFIHADFVMQIMEHVWRRKEEAEKNGDQSVTVLAPFIGQAVSDACLIGITRASLAPTGVEASEAQRKRVFIAISWLKELKKYWRPVEVMYDKLRKACKNMEKVKKPTKSALPESSSGTGSASVSPKQGLPLDNNFIPSLDSASQQIQLMQQNLVPYQQGSSLQLAYENAAYAGDMLQTVQYTHLSDLIYNVPYLYYVDAINGHGATDQLTGYAMDLDLYPNIFPELASPSTPLGTQPLGPLGMDMTVGLDQQQQQQNPMTTLSSSVLAQSPSLSSSSAHEHSHNPYLDHRRSQNEASSPAQSPAIDSPQQATDSDDEEEGEDGGDEGEDDNQEEKPEEFGHRYFEPRTTRNRMEIFHCLNSEDVKEEVREAVEAPSKNVLESDDGEADGEKEHCTSGVSNGAFVPGEGESSNSS